MKRHVLTVLMSFLAAVISGAVFVVALFHQFALVEVAASILTGLQVFFSAPRSATCWIRRRNRTARGIRRLF
jgi:hypothetical protein